MDFLHFVVVVVFLIDEILLIITMNVQWDNIGLLLFRVRSLDFFSDSSFVFLSSLELTRKTLVCFVSEYDYNEIIGRKTNIQLARRPAGEHETTFRSFSSAQFLFSASGGIRMLRKHTIEY